MRIIKHGLLLLCLSSGINANLLEQHILDGNFSKLKMALILGANTNKLTNNGFLLLDIAASENKLDMVKLLVDLGKADPFKKNIDGRTALDCSLLADAPKKERSQTTIYLADVMKIKLQPHKKKNLTKCVSSEERRAIARRYPARRQREEEASAENVLTSQPSGKRRRSISSIPSTVLMYVTNNNFSMALTTMKKLSSLDIRNKKGQTLLDISKARDQKMRLSEESSITQLLRFHGAKTATGYDYPELYCNEEL